jgi:retron-type reverse transcriptase
VPQGGPLSPLLSNLVLNDLDRELGENTAEMKFCGECGTRLAAL